MSIKDILISLAIILLVIGVNYLANPPETIPAVGSTKETKKTNQGARFRSKPLEYTKHASCRMQCRDIEVSDIKQILKSGKLDPKRSKPGDKPCPTYALNGKTQRKNNLRIVFADCKSEVRVVTAIDLEREYECSC